MDLAAVGFLVRISRAHWVIAADLVTSRVHSEYVKAHLNYKCKCQKAANCDARDVLATDW